MLRTVLPTESLPLPVLTDLYNFIMNPGTCWSRDPASLPRPSDLSNESADGVEYKQQEKLHATSHMIIFSRIFFTLNR